MKYIKSINEFFYYDGGPYYGVAKDPSILKQGDLADKEYIYSELKSKYYTEDEVREIERQYLVKFHKQTTINNTPELDNILKLIYTK